MLSRRVDDETARSSKNDEASKHLNEVKSGGAVRENFEETREASRARTGMSGELVYERFSEDASN